MGLLFSSPGCRTNALHCGFCTGADVIWSEKNQSQTNLIIKNNIFWDKKLHLCPLSVCFFFSLKIHIFILTQFLMQTKKCKAVYCNLRAYILQCSTTAPDLSSWVYASLGMNFKQALCLHLNRLPLCILIFTVKLLLYKRPLCGLILLICITWLGWWILVCISRASAPSLNREAFVEVRASVALSTADGSHNKMWHPF